MVFTKIIGMENRENQEDQSQGDHLSQRAADTMAIGLPRFPGRVSLLPSADEQVPPVNDTSDASTSSIAPLCSIHRSILTTPIHSHYYHHLALYSSQQTRYLRFLSCRPPWRYCLLTHFRYRTAARRIIRDASSLPRFSTRFIPGNWACAKTPTWRVVIYKQFN